MNYWVVAPDGNKYGPADIAVLNAWITEGRLNPDSQLEVVETGERVRAGDLSGLAFPAPVDPVVVQPSPYSTPQGGSPVDQQNPYASPQPQQVYNQQNPYPRQMQYGGDDGSQDIKNAYMFTVLGFFCCGPAIAGGIVSANKAIQKGNPGGSTARTVAIVVLSIWVILFIIRVSLLLNGVS